MLVVLSMTMATQYATTRIGYSYSIVHPSESDIRFIGSDNSTDGIRILRMTDNSTTGVLELKLGGNLSSGQNKTYTAAFGIVNEEGFPVNITHFNVSTTGGTGPDYLEVWLHGDRDQAQQSDASSVCVWSKGSVGHSSSSNVWRLGKGDNDPTTMCADGNGHTSAQLDTPWDNSQSNVRYSMNDANNSVNATSDFVWVQISINVPTGADSDLTYAGTVYVHTRASTEM